MSDTFARIRGAARMLLLFFALLALASLLPALLFRRALPTDDDPAGARLLEALVEGAPNVGGAGLSVVFLGALLALASPALSGALLSALGRRETLSASLGRGVARYGPSVSASLLLLPLLVVGVAVTLGLPALVSTGLADAAAPTHDLAAGVAALPGLGLLAFWASWHDVARARVVCLGDGALSAVRIARRRVSFGTYFVYIGCLGMALVLATLGLYTSAALPGALAFLSAQALLLGKLGTRALFLSVAVARASGAQ